MLIMDVTVLGIGYRREGEARPEIPYAERQKHERILIVINNSSVNKWRRLSQKQLDQQFTHEMIHGLQCSPFEATAMLDAVYRVYTPYFETSGTLKPGQILFQVISVDARANTPLADSEMGHRHIDLRRRCGGY